MAEKSTTKKTTAKATDNCDEPIYVEKPSLNINEDEIEGLKAMDIDSEHTLIVKAQLVNVGKREYPSRGDQANKVWGRFRVESVKVQGSKDNFEKGMDDPYGQTPKPAKQ